MLLYAKTDEIVLPNNDYKMGGNQISVKTLDLDCEFAEIKRQLDDIVQRIFWMFLIIGRIFAKIYKVCYETKITDRKEV